MGWMKVIHGYTAYVFIAAVLVRVIWMFTGNKYAHWDKFIPVHRIAPPRLLADGPVLSVRAAASLRASSATTRWRRRPTRWCSGCTFVAIATGLMLRGASADADSILRWFASLAPLFGGLYMARWIHHVVMWLLLGFAVHHVYSAVLMSTVEATARSNRSSRDTSACREEDLELLRLPLHQPAGRGR